MIQYVSLLRVVNVSSCCIVHGHVLSTCVHTRSRYQVGYVSCVLVLGNGESRRRGFEREENIKQVIMLLGPPEGTKNARASRLPSASGVSSLRGPYKRTNNERLSRRVMVGAMAGWENPGPGRPEKNRAQQCLLDDLRMFRAT